MIGRPERSEVGEYYFTYIDRVEGDDPMISLEDQLDSFLAFLAEISDEQSLYSYASGKWTIRQALSHVTDTERAFVFRALWFARGFDAPLPSFNPDTAASGAQADRISWTAHIEEFRRVRMATISFFHHLPAEAWMRNGIASDNPFTVRSLAFIIAGHVTHHETIIRDRYPIV